MQPTLRSPSGGVKPPPGDEGLCGVECRNVPSGARRDLWEVDRRERCLRRAVADQIDVGGGVGKGGRGGGVASKPDNTAQVYVSPKAGN